jgi:uncharacterized protein YndB with AHSA1/START domain
MAARAESTRADELVIERTFNAPRELVFAAWTEPRHLAHWSGPEGFTTEQDHLHLRPGGSYRACLIAPDGARHWVRGTYLTIDPPGRLVMTHAWEDEEGEPGPQTEVSVTLHEDGPGRTRMVFRQTGFATRASRDGHEGGWSSSFDRLAAHLGATA